MNTAKLYSITHGSPFTVAGQKYIGKNPVYKNMSNNPAFPKWVKVERGIPFVKVDKF